MRVARLFLVALAAIVVLCPSSARAQAPQSSALVLGVLPNIPAAVLLAQYEHMKRYLERGGVYKVQVATAANFRAFYASAVRGDFDVAVLAVQMARLAQRDAGLVPVAVFEPPISALLVSAVAQPLDSAEALRGKTVGFANPESLVAVYGLAWLHRAGLVAGKDVRIRGQRTDWALAAWCLPAKWRRRCLAIRSFASCPRRIARA